jgi:ferredoxin
MIEALGRACAAERGFDPRRMVADAFSVGPVAESLASPTIGGPLGLPPINLFFDRTVRPCAIAGVAGEALLFALKRAGVPLQAVCGGQGACGTCLVHVAPSWRRRTGQPARREDRLLQYLGAGEGDRLSCQIPLTADLDGLELHTCVENQGDSP